MREHIQEEEASRVIRKTNPAFVVSGTFVVLLLGTVAYNFYESQSELKRTLDLTANGFEVARKDLASKVSSLQNTVSGFKEKENYGLGGFAWNIQLSPLGETAPNTGYNDQVQFKDGGIVSAKFMTKGFGPFQYTITKESHGKMIWRATQTNSEGLSVSWYGIVAADKMRGVVTERPPEGPRRDFSFVSEGRVRDIVQVQNVAQ